MARPFAEQNEMEMSLELGSCEGGHRDTLKHDDRLLCVCVGLLLYSYFYISCWLYLFFCG